jgi:hypothetical protein
MFGIINNPANQHNNPEDLNPLLYLPFILTLIAMVLLNNNCQLPTFIHYSYIAPKGPSSSMFFFLIFLEHYKLCIKNLDAVILVECPEQVLPHAYGHLT